MLPLASGGASFLANSAKTIRFVRNGCANRPFFHIVVMETRREQYDPCIEQVGSYDPMDNQHGEQLVAFNFERIQYWIGSGAEVSRPVAQLLGLAGFYPHHPRTYMTAWRNRRAAAAAAAQKVAEEEAAAAKTAAAAAATEETKSEK